MKRTLLFTALFSVAACGGQTISNDNKSTSSNQPDASQASPGASATSPSCSVSLSEGCALGPNGDNVPANWWGKCESSYAVATEPSTWCTGNDQTRVLTASCGDIRAVVYAGVDDETWFYYEGDSLVAVFHDNPDGDVCIGGPQPFARPDVSSCTWGPDLCTTAVDAGTD